MSHQNVFEILNDSFAHLLFKMNESLKHHFLGRSARFHYSYGLIRFCVCRRVCLFLSFAQVVS